MNGGAAWSSYVLLGVFAVSGCSLAPIIRPRHCQSHRPILPTRNMAGASYGGPTAAEMSWHEYFVDPYLQTLIALALENR